jgi:NAD(P)-dependent dehydrogenase (short-subunit alcohol dehydrogenase family)
VATVRREDSVADLRAQHGDQLIVSILDLTDSAAIRGVVEKSFRQLGRINVIVSNAGYGFRRGRGGNGRADSSSDLRQISSAPSSSSAPPYLIAPAGRGANRSGFIEGGLYHATKWGTEGFIESVAQEVTPFGIDFIMVEPGPTATNFGSGPVRAAPIR